MGLMVLYMYKFVIFGVTVILVVFQSMNLTCTNYYTYLIMIHQRYMS